MQRVMEDPAPNHKRPRPLRFLTALVGLINLAGATVTFVYFAFIEAGLRVPEEAASVQSRILFFIVGTGLLMLAAGSAAWLVFRPLRRELSSGQAVLEAERRKILVGKLIDLPLQIAGISLLGWLASAILFGPVMQHLVEPSFLPWHVALRSMVGIAFVGAPFTVIFVYLIFEWRVRGKLRELAPNEAFSSMPRSIRLGTLPKMLVVSLMIGTIPVVVVSYVTLSQIHEVHAGRQDIALFLSQMPTVVGFLLCLAVAVAVGLSLFMTRSISDPLREAGAVMERVRRGDLDGAIPVLSNDEIGHMAVGFNRMVEGLRERDLIRTTFGAYVSEDVVEEILKSPDSVRLGGETLQVTILVADLRGFTSLTASLRPESVVRILNAYFGRMVDVIGRHGGTIDEFLGDGVLAFFGAPRRLLHAERTAVLCAVEMQAAMPSLNRELLAVVPEFRSWAERPREDGCGNFVAQPLTMGIAVASGEVVVGNIGSEKRRKYGAVGSPINVAFRASAIAGSGEIIITDEVHRDTTDSMDAEAIPDVRLKGFDEPVTLYRVSRPEGPTPSISFP